VGPGNITKVRVAIMYVTSWENKTKDAELENIERENTKIE
jgi:hypothetical protein